MFLKEPKPVTQTNHKYSFSVLLDVHVCLSFIIKREHSLILEKNTSSSAGRQTALVTDRKCWIGSLTILSQET